MELILDFLILTVSWIPDGIIDRTEFVALVIVFL